MSLSIRLSRQQHLPAQSEPTSFAALSNSRRQALDTTELEVHAALPDSVTHSLGTVPKCNTIALVGTEETDNSFVLANKALQLTKLLPMPLLCSFLPQPSPCQDQ